MPRTEFYTKAAVDALIRQDAGAPDGSDVAWKPDGMLVSWPSDQPPVELSDDDNTIFIDTETTGLDSSARPVQVAVVGPGGMALLNSLCNPGFAIPREATRIHGITDAMVRNAPPVDDVVRTAARLAAGRKVVIYNAGYDSRFIDLSQAISVSCCMLAFAEHAKEWNEYRGNWKWHKLAPAAARCGHNLGASAHGALADAQACRAIWLTLPAELTRRHVVWSPEVETAPHERDDLDMEIPF
jgi:DNA polymerase III epsilon subunit-like protein